MAAPFQNECSLPEGIRGYLLRGNIMVPLVPVDQLPFQLKGVSCQLSHRQISDQGWKLFTETTEVPFVLSVQAPATNGGLLHCSSEKSQYLAPDHHVRTESQTAPTSPNRAGRPSSVGSGTTSESLVAPFTAVVERQSSLTDAVASIYQNDAQRHGYASGTGSSPPKKVYCTHWIATGECRWMHTGCKFKHEMPGIEKLRELGFTRGTPKWWKEKNAVSPSRPLTWMQRKMTMMDDGEQQTGDNKPAPRTFPDLAALGARKLEELRNDLSYETQKKNKRLKEDQSTVPRPRLPVLPSIRAPPVRCPLQPPNLIDLDDTPPHSPTPSTEPSETSAPSTPQSDVSPIQHSLPASPATRKRKPEKLTCIRTPIPRTMSSSSPSSPSSSSSSSSSVSSETSESDAAPSKPKRTALSTQQQQHHHHHRHKMHSAHKPASTSTSTTSSTATASTSPRPVETALLPGPRGLAGSKYAVHTPVASASPCKGVRDTRLEYSIGKALSKERRAKRLV